MKKTRIIAVFLAAVMASASLYGCNSQAEKDTDNAADASSEAVVEAPPTPPQDPVDAPQEDIKPEEEIVAEPDPNFSYYDYIKENSTDSETFIMDPKAYYGEYQSDPELVDEKNVSFTLSTRWHIDDISEEELNNDIKILKNRLDLLQAPYSLSYMCFYGSVEVNIKIGTAKMGSPVITLLKYRDNGNPDSITGDAFNTKLVAQDGTYLATNLTHFRYQKHNSEKYGMYLSFEGSNLDEAAALAEIDNEIFREYVINHPGEKLYWTIADEFTAAEFTISQDMSSSKELFFSDFCFLGGKKPAEEDEFLLNLMTEALTGEQYALDWDAGIIDGGNYSVGASDADLGYNITTYIDEIIYNDAKEIYPNVKVYRPLISEYSNLNVDFYYESREDFDPIEFAEYVKQLYHSNTEISTGSYAFVYVTASIYDFDNQGEKVYSDDVTLVFQKEFDGSIKFNANNYLYDESGEALDEYLETDEFYSALASSEI